MNSGVIKAAILGGALVASASAGAAALKMEIYKNGSVTPTWVIDDNGAGDSSILDDTIAFSSFNPMFGGIDVVAANRINKNGQAVLDISHIKTTGGLQDLKIKVSGKDYSFNQGSFKVSASDTFGATTGKVAFEYKYDAGNTLFGGSSVANGSFINAKESGESFSYNSSIDSLTVNTPYSMSIIANIKTNQMGANSFSATMSAVPVPAAAWLMMSGILGLAGLSRRKKKA